MNFVKNMTDHREENRSTKKVEKLVANRTENNKKIRTENCGNKQKSTENRTEDRRVEKETKSRTKNKSERKRKINI